MKMIEIWNMGLQIEDGLTGTQVMVWWHFQSRFDKNT